VIVDELDRGRVESDGNGRVRLVAGALPPDLLHALRALEPSTDISARENPGRC
jgi:hypothetical protein